MPQEPETPITAKAVAKLTGLSVRTVYERARLGLLPCFWPSGKPTKPGEGKAVRFWPYQIRQYIKTHSSHTAKAIKDENYNPAISEESESN